MPSVPLWHLGSLNGFGVSGFQGLGFRVIGYVLSRGRSGMAIRASDFRLGLQSGAERGRGTEKGRGQAGGR